MRTNANSIQACLHSDIQQVCMSLSPSENIIMLTDKLEWFSRHAVAKIYSSLIWKVYIPGKRVKSFIEDNNIQQMELVGYFIAY